MADLGPKHFAGSPVFALFSLPRREFFFFFPQARAFGAPVGKRESERVKWAQITSSFILFNKMLKNTAGYVMAPVCYVSKSRQFTVACLDNVQKSAAKNASA